MPDLHPNFAYSTVATAPSPATSGTSLVVASGEGALFVSFPFNATIWPVGVQPTTANAEIVRVTGRSTDTLTIVRAQEGTAARTVVVGDQIAVTITNKTLVDAEYPRAQLGPPGALYETYPRQLGGAHSANMTSQTVKLTAIHLPKDLLLTSITYVTGTTALATGVHQFFGLYDSSRALLRGTTDDTSAAWAANTSKTLNLTSTFTTTYSGLHYLACLVDATTVPSMQGFPASGPATTLLALAPILAGNSSTGRTTLPDPAAAITAAALIHYAYVS